MPEFTAIPDLTGRPDLTRRPRRLLRVAGPEACRTASVVLLASSGPACAARRGPRQSPGALLAGLCAIVCVLLALPLRSAVADAGDYRVVEGGTVYLGNTRLFARPCVIKADLVYRQIAEYREILDKALTDKDVRYHFLMKKASEKFTEGVKLLARELDLDLVAEAGAVKSARRGVEAVVDRTDDVISRLR